MTESTTRAKLIWLLVLLLVAGLYAAWTRSDGLGQLGRDGPRYMMMAEHYSIYRRPDPIYSEMAAFSHLPPLYPMALAWTGASDNLFRAHLVTSLFLLLALAAYSAWLRRLGASLEQSALLMLLFAVLPGTWLTALLIQSECLYLLLSLLALALMAAYRNSGQQQQLYGAAIAIGAACLSRTVGICLLPALLLAARRAPPRTIAVALATAILPALAWHFLHHSDMDYGSQLQSLYGGHGWQTLLGQLMTEPPALRQGFEANLQNIGSLGPLADALGLLCLASMLVRAARLEPDGAYLAAYLAILLLWPYPEEAKRFVWVALPVFLAQPLLLIVSLRRAAPPQHFPAPAVAVLAGALLCLILPPLTEGAGRYWSAPYSDIPNAAVMVSWYESDPLRSRKLVTMENAFVSAMQLIPMEVAESDCVIATRPDLVGYYSHRHSKAPPLNSLPDPYFAAMARRSGCNYAYGMAFKDSIFPIPLHPLPRLEADTETVYVIAVTDEATGVRDILAALARFVPAGSRPAAGQPGNAPAGGSQPAPQQDRTN